MVDRPVSGAVRHRLRRRQPGDERRALRGRRHAGRVGVRGVRPVVPPSHVGRAGPDVWVRALERTVPTLVDGVPEGAVAVAGSRSARSWTGWWCATRDGRPLRPAMIWMDRRAEAQAAAVAERMSPAEFYGHVGANLDSSHAAFKALWVRDKEPDAFGAPRCSCRRARTCSARVERRGRGGLLERVVARAARSADADVVGGGAGGRRASTRSMLRELVAGTQAVGHGDGGVRRGDRAVAATRWSWWGAATRWRRRSGAGVYAPGEVCDVVGTAEPVCAASAEPRDDPTMLVECHPHADPDAWLLENPGFVSGGNLRWWRDQFAPTERDGRGAGRGRRLRPAVDGGRGRAAGRRGPGVPPVHAGGDGAGVERRRRGASSTD